MKAPTFLSFWVHDVEHSQDFKYLLDSEGQLFRWDRKRVEMTQYIQKEGHSHQAREIEPQYDFKTCSTPTLLMLYTAMIISMC